jgi:alpha-galactosidase
MQHMADLGVDFVKYDDIVPFPDEVEAVAKAIRKTGRGMVLSLSPGGKVDPDAINSFRMANMLRVTGDIWDEQRDLDLCFAAWRKWQGKEQPGFWIDMDMIPFGPLQLMSPPSASSGPESRNAAALAGKGHTRQCQLSKSQMETFITLRALSASPLMVGGDLPGMDDFSLRLLTDADMIACNQNGVMGRLVYDQDQVETWLAEQQGTPGTGWLGIFNRTDQEKEVALSASLLGLKAGGHYAIKEIWRKQNFACPSAQPARLTIAPHGALFMRYQARDE